jgi:hypothetical protein
MLRTTPDEAELIERGVISYGAAQLIRSEDQLLAIKQVCGDMSCEACGLQFASNRLDSKERHIKGGAWYGVSLLVKNLHAHNILCLSASVDSNGIVNQMTLIPRRIMRQNGRPERPIPRIRDGNLGTL